MKRTLLTTLAAVAFVGTYAWAQFGTNFSTEILDQPTGQALAQAYAAVEANYLDEVDSEAILRGAINGMIEALDDPFSFYLEPRSAEREAEDRSGSFEGIGAVLTPLNRQTGEGVEILQVYAGGPASGAGVQRGDIFLEVDGVDVRNKTTSDVVDLVRGPGGTIVNLLMRRPGESEPVEFAIRRDTIEIIDVTSTMIGEDVGYINIRQFGNQRVHEQLVESLAKLQLDGAEMLVLDMRDNPGGLLTQGIRVADQFLSDGDIVFQRARGVTQRIASASPAATDIPLVVLVNENSASASEIVAGALQQNGRALVVGESTFGKGVAQSVTRLADGGQLAYTAFEWLTPARESIADGGIVPDVYAEDSRFPSTVRIDGAGLSEGQTVEIIVDGESIGTAQADESGEIEFFTTGPRPEISPIQDEAVVNLASDPALQTAIEVLRSELAAN